MFQIETALLKFDGMEGSEGKSSVVKQYVKSRALCCSYALLTNTCRLFYGKTKQKLIHLDNPTGNAQPSLKEELFTHLPINVAADGADLYDGLGSFFNDVVDFEGKKSRMEISMLDVPPLLQIQLQVSNHYPQPGWLFD